MDSGIEDGRTFFHELPDLLRPGGILLVVLGNFMHGQDRKIVTQEDENAPVRAQSLHHDWDDIDERLLRRTFRGWRCSHAPTLK